jgi:parallel beta-helix repeat protein
MHVHVEELPTKESPASTKKRKILLWIMIIGVVICLGVGTFILLQPPPVVEQPNVTEVIPGYKIDFQYELGVIPASFNQHVVKITHGNGDVVENMSEMLWVTVYPPESTPYLRRTPVIHTSKYMEFSKGGVLYIYLGKDHKFYASKELPNYDQYIDFPDGSWGIHIDDARYKSPISDYDFSISKSKTHIIDKTTRIQSVINNANEFDTIIITGKDAIYHEQLTIDSKPIRLLGMDYPIIDAGGSNSVITVLNSSYSEISNLNIINSGITNTNNAGILLFYSDNTIISNNTIRNNQNGIYMIGSVKNTVTYNQIFSNDISGLVLALGSNSNTIKENSFQLNTFGIYIKDASDANYVVRNTGQGNTRYGIIIDNELKNIYEYNNFSYDKMSYDKIIEQNLTTVSAPKSDADTWLTTCGAHESPYSPACQGKKDTTDY